MKLEAGEQTRAFGLATLLFAWFFEMAMGTGFPQRTFAVEFLFQPTQGFFHRLAFFEFNFRQLDSRSSLAQQTLSFRAAHDSHAPRPCQSLSRVSNPDAPLSGCQYEASAPFVRIHLFYETHVTIIRAIRLPVVVMEKQGRMARGWGDAYALPFLHPYSGAPVDFPRRGRLCIVPRVNGTGQEVPATPPLMATTDWVWLAQGFYAVFFGQLVVLLSLFQALTLPGLRMLQLVLSGVGVMVLLSGAWRLFQVRHMGVDWHKRARDLLWSAGALAYFWPLFQLWMRAPERVYLLVQALIFTGICIYLPTLVCSAVAPLARSLGHKSLQTQAVLFGAAAFISLFVPFAVVARALLVATKMGTDPLMAIQMLLQSASPVFLFAWLLPASLALSLPWSAKDVALRQLMAKDAL
jgi:hypothetical protein